jgi:hypothetical protein
MLSFFIPPLDVESFEPPLDLSLMPAVPDWPFIFASTARPVLLLPGVVTPVPVW